eukprot:Nitzschia sp. Nitz4//scaffold15_size197535//175839//177117//NITZ4_001608-RA/size197535-augustus-gene-0.217-mRNA-1//1//CDS//3329537805//7998//frame0
MNRGVVLSFQVLSSWFYFLHLSSAFTLAPTSLSLFRKHIPQSPRFMTSQSTNLVSPKDIRILSGVRELVDKYDTFLIDMWGVLHDGSTPYEGVLQTLSQMKEASSKKQFVLLSNSSKGYDRSLVMLNKLGFDTSMFQHVLTSGEVTYDFLTTQVPSASKKLFCFGNGDGDKEFVEQCGWTLSTVEEADLILARGTAVLFDEEAHRVHSRTCEADDYAGIYEKVLAHAAQRQLPMVVANPDKVVPGALRTPMPGTIAVDYEQQLASIASPPQGLIHYMGKPFPRVYQLAIERCGLTSTERACMIGDALETDMFGGANAGMDTIWVTGDGVHQTELEQHIASSTSGKVNVAECDDNELANSCATIINTFNEKKGTYAEGTRVLPKAVLRHFHWERSGA